MKRLSLLLITIAFMVVMITGCGQSERIDSLEKRVKSNEDRHVENNDSWVRQTKYDGEEPGRILAMLEKRNGDARVATTLPPMSSAPIVATPPLAGTPSTAPPEPEALAMLPPAESVSTPFMPAPSTLAPIVTPPPTSTRVVTPVTPAIVVVTPRAKVPSTEPPPTTLVGGLSSDEIAYVRELKQQDALQKIAQNSTRSTSAIELARQNQQLLADKEASIAARYATKEDLQSMKDEILGAMREMLETTPNRSPVVTPGN